MGSQNFASVTVTKGFDFDALSAIDKNDRRSKIRSSCMVSLLAPNRYSGEFKLSRIKEVFGISIRSRGQG
jgi:hypothetical protein